MSRGCCRISLPRDLIVVRDAGRRIPCRSAWIEPVTTLTRLLIRSRSRFGRPDDDACVGGDDPLVDAEGLGGDEIVGEQ